MDYYKQGFDEHKIKQNNSRLQLQKYKLRKSLNLLTTSWCHFVLFSGNSVDRKVVAWEWLANIVLFQCEKTAYGFQRAVWLPTF